MPAAWGSRADLTTAVLSAGKVVRMLTLVDDSVRECPAIEVDTSLGELGVCRVLDRMIS